MINSPMSHLSLKFKSTLDCKKRVFRVLTKYFYLVRNGSTTVWNVNALTEKLTVGGPGVLRLAAASAVLLAAILPAAAELRDCQRAIAAIIYLILIPVIPVLLR